MKAKEKYHPLFLGPYQPALEEAFLNLIKRKKDRDSLAPAVVLVGSNLLGVYLRRLLVLKGLDHFNIRFLTFIDLAKALAAEPLSQQEFHPLPRFGDLVCVSILAKKIETNAYFRPIADRRGFQRSLLGTFQDLWDGGVEDLRVKNEKKLLEIDRLYQGYREMIGKGFYNESHLLFCACNRVSNFREVFGCRQLILYGFYDFTENQRQLVKACAEELEITAFMPWRESSGFGYAAMTLQWYQDVGFQVNPMAKPVTESHHSLQWLQRNLFQEKATGLKTPDDGAVAIIAAPSEVQEVREIAREILRIAQEDNIPFQEMAILLRTPDFYGNLIQEMFQNLGIPFYLQGGIPLVQTQEGKSTLLLLDLIGTDLPRAQVMEFLTFAPIAWSRFFKEEPSPSQWDLISRQAGIVEGRKQWEGKLSALFSRRKDEEQIEDLNGVMWSGQTAVDFWKFLQDFFAGLERIPRKGTWKEIAEAIVNLMEAYFEESEGREAIFEILRDMVSLDSFIAEVDRRQFQEIFAEALKVKKLKQGAFQMGGVCVLDLMPARGLSFRVVFIPGLVERVFPAPARQDPLLLDHERRKMNDVLGKKGNIPLKRLRFHEEKILFSLGVGSAREKLILSYPRLDPSSGRERIPSFFLLKVAEALHGEAMDYTRLEALPEFRRVALSRFGPEHGEQAIDEGEFDLAQIARALKRKDRREIAYLKPLFPVLQRAENLARFRWGFRSFTEYDGCLHSTRALHLLQGRFALSKQILSPTRLETYASCPFQYFLSTVLGLQSFPPPEEILRIQPLDRGRVVHDLLFRFYREVVKKNIEPFQPEQIDTYEKVLVDVAEQVFSEAETAGITGAPLLWEIDRQEILEDLRRFIKKEWEESLGWIPTHFEIGFGHQNSRSKAASDTGAISLSLEGRSTVSFRGRIDRVDFSPDASCLRVIDYKTGNVEGRQDGFSGGTALQLPLYLLASCRIWKEADIEKSFAEYDSVSRKGRFKRLQFLGENWPEKEKTLKKIIHIISRGILEGTFFPYREEDGSCDFCDFRALCEQGTDALFQRKRTDPRAKPFLEMKTIP
jgi:ATP-dependent helicase/nuclease subunit B